MAHNDNKLGKESEEKSPWYLNFWFLSSVALFLWGAAWLILWLLFGDSNLSNDQADSWISAGTFGDMFGCLTCLFTGISVAGIIVTLQQQKQALHVQQDELRALKTQAEKQEQINKKTFIHKLIDGYITFRNITPVILHTHDEKGQVYKESLTHREFIERFKMSQGDFLNQLLMYVENMGTEGELENSYQQLHYLIEQSSDYQLHLLHLFGEIRNSELSEKDKKTLLTNLFTLVGSGDTMLLYHKLAVHIKEEDLEMICHDWGLEKLRKILYDALCVNSKESAKLAASTIYVEVVKSRKLCVWADSNEQPMTYPFDLAEWVIEYNKRKEKKTLHSST